jgi:hypothetical protein
VIGRSQTAIDELNIENLKKVRSASQARTGRSALAFSAPDADISRAYSAF